MDIVWHNGFLPDPVWPDGWPVPRVGDKVSTSDTELTVSAVVWHPAGEEEGDDPFVYVVLH